MKKQFMMLAAIGVGVCCLAACEDKDKINEYESLNAMLDGNYSQIEITITDDFDENKSLKSDYIIKYIDSATVNVEYSVEKFTEISLDNPAPDVKTTLTGEAVIKDGVISGGEEVGLTADIAKLGLNFNENFFTNVQLSGNYFIADVEYPNAFLGLPIECNSMKVEATFLEVFYDIHVSYVSASGSNVEYTYIFTL